MNNKVNRNSGSYLSAKTRDELLRSPDSFPILMYQGAEGNWAGIGVNGSGNILFRVGTTNNNAKIYLLGTGINGLQEWT